MTTTLRRRYLAAGFTRPEFDRFFRNHGYDLSQNHDIGYSVLIRDALSSDLVLAFNAIELLGKLRYTRAVTTLSQIAQNSIYSRDIRRIACLSLGFLDSVRSHLALLTLLTNNSTPSVFVIEAFGREVTQFNYDALELLLNTGSSLERFAVIEAICYHAVPFKMQLIDRLREAISKPDELAYLSLLTSSPIQSTWKVENVGEGG